MANIPLLMKIMASSIAVSSRAGLIIRDVMTKGELGIVEKGKNDLQTEADRSAQRCIIASLTSQYPNVKIIGEEDNQDISENTIPTDWLVTTLDETFLKNQCPEEYSDTVAEDFVVWVDPLDGTSEYTQGFVDHVTILIGIAIRDKAIGGVIHQPFYKPFNDRDDQLGRTIWGVKGLGTSGYVETTSNRTDNRFIITTTRSHSNELIKKTIDELAPTSVLRVGGAGYKVLQLLEGIADAYVFPSSGCKKWDTCAPEAVLEAAGGRLTDMLGRQYTYGPNVTFVNRGGVLATLNSYDKDLHKKLIDRIPDDVKEALK